MEDIQGGNLVMKKKFIKLTGVAFASVLLLSGCSQWTARNFGGDYDVTLPENQKLVDVAWKEDSLWYLTRPMKDEEEAETYTFQEDAVMGVLEGTVTIKEIKSNQ